MLVKRALTACLGLTALLFAGCTGCGDEGTWPGYCDSTGCFACSGPDTCWPVPHASCSSDLDCPPGEVCTDIGCAAGCSDDADCRDGEVCDGTTDFCAPAGVSPQPVDPPGSGGPETVPVPESCTTDEECQRADATLVCDEGRCIDACTSDDQCPEGYICAPCGKCTPEDTPTCGDTRVYCDATDPMSCGPDRACLTGHCHVTCDPETACPIGQVCLTGVCVDDPAPQSPQCTFNSQCTDAYCINGYCHPACGSDEECGDAEFCNDGVCMPDYSPVL